MSSFFIFQRAHTSVVPRIAKAKDQILALSNTNTTNTNKTAFHTPRYCFKEGH